MVLKNKAILIISSEAWGKIFISKHHYAVALAELGNRVYFLNPVNFNLLKGDILIETSSVDEKLFIISHRPFFPWILKFHVKWLFDVLIKVQVKRILKKINAKIDIVWDFNCSYLYNDLSMFNAEIKIFHPVDMLGVDVIKKKADIVFSVSPLILHDYKVPGVPKFLINHGLSKEFEVVANRPTSSDNYKNRPIKVCYIGNLLIPSLDRELIKQLVLIHTNITFTFIGPFSHKKNNIYNDYKEEDETFISFLNNCSNTIFTNTLSPAEIANEIDTFDAFIVCYKKTAHFRCDNSHKVLEYLSTGKVVISTPLLFYESYDVIEMSNKAISYEDLFDKIINDLDHYNSIRLMDKRKSFAKENTYKKHISKINMLITENVLHAN